MKNLFFAFITLAVLPAFAQTDVSSFLPGTAEGVTYSLPNTVIEVKVDAMCITRKPGEFHRYADRFLRISNVISSEEKFWQQTGIEVGLSGKPNPEKMFTIKLNNSSASNIRLTDDGIIAAINTEPEADKPVEAQDKKKEEKIDARRYMTEEILQATSTAKMAELVAKEIYAIRESKMAITRGQADNMPKDGVSMQLVLDELTKQEEAYLALFTGTVDTLRVSHIVRFTPSTDAEKAILFRFSRKLGITDNANLAGAPVYYDLKNLHSVYMPSPEEIKKKEIKKEGVCYNVPGKAQFKIYTTGNVLYENEIPLAQYGVTEVLAKNLFNRGATTKVLFDTATGGIMEIEK